MLAAEPFCRMPWVLARLTPFQVHEVVLVERDKKGAVILDPPFGDDGPAETTLEQEWVAHYRRAGVADPDVVRRLAAAAAARGD